MGGSRLRKMAFVLLAGVVVALGSYIGAQAAAYAGTVYGRTTWHGYFTDAVDTNGIEVLPAISNGQAIPNSVNTVSELIGLLKAANTSGDTQRQTGSAFIIYTMLGRDGANYSRTVSAADWTDITKRLNDRQAKNKIVWGGNVSDSINSYYQGGGDDAFFDEPRDERGIQIYKDDGTVAYKLLRRCANPMGRENGGIPLPVPPQPAWALTPTAISNPTTAAPGAQVTFNYAVQNSGAVASSNPTTWSVKEIVYPPGGPVAPLTIPGQHDEGKCADYPGRRIPPGLSCTTLQNGSSPGFKPGTSSSTLVAPVAGTTDFQINATSETLNIPPNSPLGTRYCRLLTVDPGQVDLGGTIHVDSAGPPQVLANNRWSALSCVTVTVSPVAYFEGGDIWAGGTYNSGGPCGLGAQIYGATNAIGSNNYVSSNSQFGALATGRIRAFGSAGRVWKGSFATSLGFDSLMFANTTPSIPGNSGMSHCLTDFYKTGASLGNPPQPVNVDQLANGTYYYNNVTLKMSAPGARISGNVTIIADGVVTVTGNLFYNPSPVPDTTSLPRLIVASLGNMTIANAVQEIDGIYQTHGTFSTCAATPLNATSCPLKLTVNGSVIASHVKLRRTGGDVASPNRLLQASEYFNFTPDTILANYTRSISAGQIQTDQETELPPRY